MSTFARRKGDLPKRRLSLKWLLYIALGYFIAKAGVSFLAFLHDVTGIYR